MLLVKKVCLEPWLKRKKDTFTRQVFTNWKTAMFILHKAQLFCAQIKAQKCASRPTGACITNQSPKHAAHQTHNVHALAGQLWWHVRPPPFYVWVPGRHHISLFGLEQKKLGNPWFKRSIDTKGPKVCQEISHTPLHHYTTTRQDGSMLSCSLR